VRLYQNETKNNIIVGNSPITYSISNSKYVCNDCKLGIHTHTNHSIWIEGDEETRIIACKCEACQDEHG